MKDPNATLAEERARSTPAETPSERGRPGKRSIEEKRRAVLDLLAGKATAERTPPGSDVVVRSPQASHVPGRADSLSGPR